MGASHNVFIGNVLSQIGTIGQSIGGGRAFPLSQLSVEPIYNIKGNLQGTVSEEQAGGYQNGVLIVSEGGDMFGPSNKPGAGYLLQPGSTYLLATRYQDDGSYYLWAFPTGAKLISDDSNLGDSQLQSIAANDERVQQLEVAYPNEVLFSQDVRNGNTRNSWISLHTPPPAPPPPPAAPPSSTVELNPPVISDLTATATSTTVTISWTTNKPATSQLLFGSSTAMSAHAPSDANETTTHSIQISNLVPGTTYYYEAQSTDPSGKSGNSPQQSFTTDVSTSL